MTTLCEGLDIPHHMHQRKLALQENQEVLIGPTYHVDSQRTGRGGGVTSWSDLLDTEKHLDTERKRSIKATLTLRRVFECEQLKQSHFRPDAGVI